MSCAVLLHPVLEIPRTSDVVASVGTSEHVGSDHWDRMAGSPARKVLVSTGLDTPLRGYSTSKTLGTPLHGYSSSKGPDTPLRGYSTSKSGYSTGTT
jgi:hypothetical protein